LILGIQLPIFAGQPTWPPPVYHIAIETQQTAMENHYVKKRTNIFMNKDFFW